MIKTVKLTDIKPNPDNPRVIKDDDFKDLVKSLKNFPEMTEVREIVVNKDMMILGGNQRYRAMQEAGWEKCKVKIVDWSEEKQREFIIKDNVQKGEHDWDLLRTDWDLALLEDWGLKLPEELEDNEQVYTRKIVPPTYEPTGEKPKLKELIDTTKTDSLVAEIQQSKLAVEIKDFLVASAQRHTVFNYASIAEYYAHAEPELQDLMEKSALIIIDFKQAIENGFIRLSEEIAETFYD